MPALLLALTLFITQIRHLQSTTLKVCNKTDIGFTKSAYNLFYFFKINISLDCPLIQRKNFLTIVAKTCRIATCYNKMIGR